MAGTSLPVVWAVWTRTCSKARGFEPKPGIVSRDTGQRFSFSQWVSWDDGCGRERPQVRFMCRRAGNQMFGVHSNPCFPIQVCYETAGFMPWQNSGVLVLEIGSIYPLRVLGLSPPRNL